MTLTDYAEGQVRDWLSQGTDLTAPTSVDVGLHNSDPGEAPDGSTEVNSDGNASDYSRESVSAGTGWDTPNENDFTNANEIAWAEATNDWGTITHASIWDGSGNCLVTFPVDTSKTISTGDQAKFNAGNLSFSID